MLGLKWDKVRNHIFGHSLFFKILEYVEILLYVIQDKK